LFADLACSRRRALFAAAGAALAFTSRRLLAGGRAPVGGSLALHLPWPTATIDPHRSDDATSAILGAALFESLYAYPAGEGGGAAVPALAESDVEPTRTGLRVGLRAGIRTAHDRPIDARDVAASIARARSLGARGWLADVPAPRLDGRGALVFPMHDTEKLLRALSSPLVAIVPATFSPERPDGTGPFRAERRGDALVLSRSARAAEGPAFLDEVVVHPSADLAAPLRAFEAGEDTLGWLGSGLHEPRPGAKLFDFGAVAWAVLRTGREASTWDAPGIAQRIADGIPYARVAYLVLGPPWSPQSEQGWGGAPCDLLVRDDAPWLVELAKAVAATIARPAHEVSVRAVPAAEIAQRRTSRAFSLLLDVARPLAPTPLGMFVGLATADDPATAPDIALHPPRLDVVAARTLTRTMRLGVVGEIRVQGARMPDVTLAASPAGGLGLGDATRARKGP
jgi:peptide/nickel transport system substrate-binding protein